MKFLILNHSIQNFTGSEINALQLCMGLRTIGFEADLGTFTTGDPLKKIYENMGITCINLLEENDIEMKYDVIWAHHSPVLSHLLFKKKVQNCKILFSSLSTIHPLETPPSYSDDIHCFLSHNAVNTKFMVKNGVLEKRIHYFPNYAPQIFFEQARKLQSKSLSNLVIVSNNKATEIIELIESLKNNKVNVDVVGSQGEQVFVDQHLLSKYDLVITIGKTIQYCFALKIPVYCYDHFGGPGFITKENYELAKNNNFSGRGFNTFLDANQLFLDITENFLKSQENIEFLFQKAKDEFCLETNLRKLMLVIDQIPETDIGKFKENNSVVERINDIYINELKEKNLLRKQLIELTIHVNNLNTIIKNQQIELGEIKSSFIWKFTNKIGKFTFRFFPNFINISKEIKSLIRKYIHKRKFSKGDIDLIRESILFDENWYCENYPDVKFSTIDPLEHFLLYGIYEGRDPNPNFSTNKYYQRYHELLLEGKNPLLDIITRTKSNDL